MSLGNGNIDGGMQVGPRHGVMQLGTVSPQALRPASGTGTPPSLPLTGPAMSCVPPRWVTGLWLQLQPGVAPNIATSPNTANTGEPMRVMVEILIERAH